MNAFDDPWMVAAYRTKLRTLYRAAMGKKRGQPVQESTVRNYGAWLVPKASWLRRHVAQKYKTASVRSSMMLPVASALRMTLGSHHPTAEMWRQGAVDLRVKADEAKALNTADAGFLDYSGFVERRHMLRSVLPSEDLGIYWKWLVLCLYTLQPPLRSEWGEMLVVSTEPKVSEPQNYLLLSGRDAVIVIQRDKVSKSMGEGRIPVSPELLKVLRASLTKYPRRYVLPRLRKDGYDPEEALGQAAVKRLLADAVGRDVNRPLQRVRAAYSSHALAHNLPLSQLKAIARAQRHSLGTMMLHYRVLPRQGELPVPKETHP
jgi:hypothetical protein